MDKLEAGQEKKDYKKIWYKTLISALAVITTLLLILLLAAQGKMKNYADGKSDLAVINPGEQYSISTEMEETQDSQSTEETALTEETIIEEDGMKIPDGFTKEELDNMEINAPQDYSITKALAVLSSRVDIDTRYEEIIEKKDSYPEKLLINLANNPELLSFVYDYPGGTDTDVQITDNELNRKCPLFLQWDKRWGYQSYGDNSNIAVSGCGPTALSMVVVGLTGDTQATPNAVADYAMKNDFFMYGTGTMWKLMTDGAAHFGLVSEQIDRDKELMDLCLSEGGMLICSVGPGDFTPVGHFIVIYDQDEEGYIINDPFCIHRSNEKWSYEQLRKQMKAVWALHNS